MLVKLQTNVHLSDSIMILQQDIFTWRAAISVNTIG